MAKAPSLPHNLKGVVRNSIDFRGVGIGASTGGLAALQTLLEKLPANNGMAFVIVLHLAPLHRSNARDILQRATEIPVVLANGPTIIEKDHVYISPPGKRLSMNDSYLRVAEWKRPVGSHVAVDLFFRSLADVHRERAIGIVLSGTGADGSIGLSRLKE